MERKNGVLLKIVSFLIPIVGLVIYEQNVRQDEKFAHSCIKWSLVSVGLMPILFVLLIAVLNAAFFMQKVSYKVEERVLLEDIPVVAIYNEEAYVVEGVPEYVDVEIKGVNIDADIDRITLDLTDYSSKEGTYRVEFEIPNELDSFKYTFTPAYVEVSIKDKVSQVFGIEVEWENLDDDLLVTSLNLSREDVIVKGSRDQIENIANVKAVINARDLDEAGVHLLKGVELLAYDESGRVIENVEVVPRSVDVEVELAELAEGEKQKIIDVSRIVAVTNLGEGLSINMVNTELSVTVMGADEAVDEITEKDLRVSIDLNGLDEGEHTLDLIVECDNPLVKVVPNSQVVVQIKNNS